MVALRHPVDEQRVRDRQHHRPDEEPGDAEGDEPTDYAREDQQQRQVGTVLGGAVRNGFPSWTSPVRPRSPALIGTP